MLTREFKKVFGAIAKKYGFAFRHGAWFMEFPEVINVLDVYKSYYSTLYYLNVKQYIQGAFGRQHEISKELVQYPGHTFSSQPRELQQYLDFNQEISLTERIDAIDNYFERSLMPYIIKTQTKGGIIKLYYEEPKEVYLMPAVCEQLGIEYIPRSTAQSEK